MTVIDPNDCTSTKTCNHHNLRCSYPDCAWGKKDTLKKDTAFPEAVEFLNDVIGVVDANSFEKMCLWRDRGNMVWEDGRSDLFYTIGYIEGRPITLLLHIAYINGYKILFIDSPSQLVDHKMIEKWLEENLPKSAMDSNGYINRTEAMNFHNVFPRQVKREN